MTDDNNVRPRRGMPSGDDQVDPVDLDDTPAEVTFPGRRGRFEDAGTSDQSELEQATDPAAEATPAAAPSRGMDSSYDEIFRPGEERRPASDSDPDPNTLTMTLPHEHTAFMRPGSAPVVEVEVPLAELAVAPMVDESGALVVDDPEVIAAVRAAAAKAENGGDVVAPATAAADLDALKGDEAPHDDAIVAGNAHRKRWGPWAKAGVAALAVILAGGIIWGVRSVRDSGEPVASPSASSAKPSISSAPAVLTTSMLVQPADAKAALGDQGWKVSQTWNPVTENEPVNISCQSAKLTDLPNSTASMQQGLRSSGKLAVLQRLDSFATEAEASKAYALRAQALAACSDQTTLLDSGATLTGAGDEGTAVQLTYQVGEQNHHSVMVVRTGTVVSMIDISDVGKQIELETLLKAGLPTLTKACGPAKGNCPANPTIKAAPVPPTPVLGWPTSSDVPRITQNQGTWVPTEPAAVTNQAGTTCEQVDLKTGAKAAKAEQRTYLLQQDTSAPADFGFDVVRYSFEDEDGAQTWAKTLTKNLDACGGKIPTAKVTEAAELKSTGADDQEVTGKTWLVGMKTDKGDLTFRVGVTVVGNQVTYTMIKQDKFGFSDADWQFVTLRAGVRASQAG